MLQRSYDGFFSLMFCGYTRRLSIVAAVFRINLVEKISFKGISFTCTNLPESSYSGTYLISFHSRSLAISTFQLLAFLLQGRSQPSTFVRNFFIRRFFVPRSIQSRCFLKKIRKYLRKHLFTYKFV